MLLGKQILRWRNFVRHVSYDTRRSGRETRAHEGATTRVARHYGRMSVGLIGVRVGKVYWQEPEWQLANEGYVSLFR